MASIYFWQVLIILACAKNICRLHEVFGFVSEYNNSKWIWPYIQPTKIPIPLLPQDDPSALTPTRSSSSYSKRIQASIIPIVYPPLHSDNQSSLDPMRTTAKAQIQVIVTKKNSSLNLPLEDPDRNFFSASSNIMEFEFDNQMFLSPTGHNRRRHSGFYNEGSSRKKHLRRHLPSNSTEEHSKPLRDTSDDSTSEKQCKTCKKRNKKRDGKNSKRRRRLKLRLPVRALLYESSNSNLGTAENFRRILQPLRLPVFSRHTPTRVFIPIWRGDVEKDDQGTCIRCPRNHTMTANRGTESVVLPIPTVAICPKLARKRGILNLAVTSGPRPGAMLQEGDYPTELIAWKTGGQVYPCQYTVSVKVLRCPDVEPPIDGNVTCTNGAVWGSRCKFTCSTDFILQGSSLVFCEGDENGVSWTTQIPTCEKVSKQKNIPLPKKFCKKPSVPENGTIVCGSQNLDPKDTYTEGSICQFFCYPGFKISPTLSSNGLIVCKSGNWSPRSNFTCLKRVPPQPDPKDCRNKILYTNGKGKAFIKKPKFYGSKNGPKSSLRISCSHSGEVTAGMYINNCSAYDPELNVTGSCSYRIIVKERSCPPLKPIPHGQIRCHNLPKTPSGTLYPPHVVCEYVCSRGYAIPVKQRKWKKRKCSPKLKWNVNKLPTCKKAESPRLHPEDCQDRTLFLEGDQSFVNLTLPRAETSPKGRQVKIECSLNSSLSVGNYTNTCQVTDLELPLSSSCTYNISVRAKTCPSLPNVEFADLQCTTPETKHGYVISSLCSYICDSDHVIPTSMLNFTVKICTVGGQWNDTNLPTCLEKTLPQPLKTSCQNQTIILESDAEFHLPFQQFITSNNETITGNCTPSSVQEAGLHQFLCSAHDEELRLNNTCEFFVNLSPPNKTEEEEPEIEMCAILPDIEFGSIQCSIPKEENGHPLSSSCRYLCFSGYVIPTSELPLVTKRCTSEGQWNDTTSPTCQRSEPPKIVAPGCIDLTLEISNISEVNISYPEFSTVHNTSAEANCSSFNITEVGSHIVECKAFDPELRTSASCTFNVTIYINETTEEYPTEVPVIDCEPLVAPANGQATCRAVEIHRICDVQCDEGYGFPSSYPLLHLGSVTCDGNDGMWNFQRLYDISKLPDCLRELPTTSVEVWLGFTAAVENCDDDHISKLKHAIKDQLLEMNEDPCSSIVCNATFDFNCSFDESKNRLALNTTWKIQAAFDPKDYEDSKDVPLVEIQIETIMETTQKAVTTEKKFRDSLLDLGAELWQDSYKQGHIILVCQTRGFVVDSNSDRCVECPKDTYEKDGECRPCPEGFYQKKSGQTICESCNSTTIDSEEMIPLTCKGT